MKRMSARRVKVAGLAFCFVCKSSCPKNFEASESQATARDFEGAGLKANICFDLP